MTRCTRIVGMLECWKMTPNCQSPFAMITNCKISTNTPNPLPEVQCGRLHKCDSRLLLQVTQRPNEPLTTSNGQQSLLRFVPTIQDACTSALATLLMARLVPTARNKYILVRGAAAILTLIESFLGHIMILDGLSSY